MKKGMYKNGFVKSVFLAAVLVVGAGVYIGGGKYTTSSETYLAKSIFQTHSGNAGMVQTEQVPAAVSMKQVPLLKETDEASSGIGVHNKHSVGVFIYISKIGKTLTLYEDGAMIGVYPVSLGEKSGIGDKEIEGDRKTPSGEFYICTLNGSSAYYLGLGLSYPDISDAERGYEAGIITEKERDSIVNAINAGEKPPWKTALGGEIEIHGERYPGGATAGCIAVDNDVMDLLWQYSQLGVPVTIGP